jgi:hypothetical protein
MVAIGGLVSTTSELSSQSERQEFDAADAPEKQLAVSQRRLGNCHGRPPQCILPFRCTNRYSPTGSENYSHPR